MKTITLTKLRIKKISELNLIRFANGGKKPFVFITAVNELDESIKVRVYGESKIKECAYYLNNQRRIDLEITLQSPKASKVESISEWTENSWKKEPCTLDIAKKFIKLEHAFDDIVESTFKEAEIETNKLIAELKEELKYLNYMRNLINL